MTLWSVLFLHWKMNTLSPWKLEWGFLFPAFVNRSSDNNVIDIFNTDSDSIQTEMMEKELGTKVV